MGTRDVVRQPVMLPIVVGLALASALGIGRAAWRARQRLMKLPPSAFGIIDVQSDSKTCFLPGGFAPSMTYSEALDILNLPSSPPPTRQQLLANHRRVMLANHPDHGGSTYMALKINEARQVVGNQIS